MQCWSRIAGRQQQTRRDPDGQVSNAGAPFGALFAFVGDWVVNISGLTSAGSTLDSTDQVIVWEGSGGNVTTTVSAPHVATIAQFASAVGAAGMATLRLGSPPAPFYLGEVYESDAAMTSDRSIFQISGVASVDTTRNTEFWGLSGLRINMTDQAGVVDGGVGVGTDPYLYGLRVRMSPRVGRNNSAIDDVVGVCVTNKSFTDYGTVFNGTEAVYVGHSGGATKDWNAGVGVDTIADNAYYAVRGPYAYGMLITASITTAALRIPNAAKIVARNAANSANLDVIYADAGDSVRLGSAAVKVVAGNPTGTADAVTHLEVHGLGVTDGNVGSAHMRIVSTTAFAADKGGTLTFCAYKDATPTMSAFGAITGRKANATSGNTAGYLGLWSRSASTGLVEVLRLTELQMLQVTDASNFIFGTTTGTKFGTATSQKIGFFNATPVIQPTGTPAASTDLATVIALANSLRTNLLALGLVA